MRTGVRACALVALLLTALARPADALQIRLVTTEAGTVLRLRGEVKAGDYQRLSAILGSSTVIGLDIESSGGILEEGIEIARLVRDNGLTVYARKECDSVCAFIFFAATERFIAPGCRIGVHSISNDSGAEDGGTVRLTVQLSRLLARFGVPHAVLGKMITTLPRDITFLDQRDLAAMNVQRRNPYARTREAPAERQAGLN